MPSSSATVTGISRTTRVADKNYNPVRHQNMNELKTIPDAQSSNSSKRKIVIVVVTTLLTMASVSAIVPTLIVPLLQGTTISDTTVDVTSTNTSSSMSTVSTASTGYSTTAPSGNLSINSTTGTGSSTMAPSVNLSVNTTVGTGSSTTAPSGNLSINSTAGNGSSTTAPSGNLTINTTAGTGFSTTTSSGSSTTIQGLSTSSASSSSTSAGTSTSACPMNTCTFSTWYSLISSGYYGVEHVDINCTQTLSNFTAQIVVQQTLGATFGAQYNTFWSNTVTMTNYILNSQIIYTWTIIPGQLISSSGFPYYVEAQFQLTGLNQTVSNDSYSIVTQAACNGLVLTQTGYF